MRGMCCRLGFRNTDVPRFLKMYFFWYKNYCAAAQDRIVCNYNHYVIQSSFKNLLMTVWNFKQVFFLVALSPCASSCSCPDLVGIMRNVFWNGVKTFQIQQDMSLASCQVMLSGFLWTFPIISLSCFLAFTKLKWLITATRFITSWCLLLTVPEVPYPVLVSPPVLLPLSPQAHSSFFQRSLQ